MDSVTYELVAFFWQTMPSWFVVLFFLWLMKKLALRV